MDKFVQSYDLGTKHALVGLHARAHAHTYGHYITTSLKVACGNRMWKTITYKEQQILTYSMVQSPSWEANWFAASQEIPRIL